MRRIGALFLLAVVLSGCGKGVSEVERGMALRSKLLQAGSCSFEAKITADYGDKLHTFSLECRGGNNGDLSFSEYKSKVERKSDGKIRTSKHCE